MGSIEKLIDASGHAAQYRPARGGSNIGALLVQGAMLEHQILQLIEADPVGAAKSFLGRAHLQRYGWMLGDVGKAEDAANCRLFGDAVPNWNYPFQFGLKDVLLEAKWVLAQLVAEECWGGSDDADPEPSGQELSPYTTDAFIGVWMGEEGMDGEPLPDPFEMDEPRHPPGIVVKCEETGEYLAGSGEPPAEGFREMANG